MKAIPYFVIYLLVIAFLRGLVGGWLWPLLVPIWVFVLIPLLDRVLGHDASDPDDAELARRADNPLYDFVLRLWVPVQLALIGASLVRLPTLSIGEAALLAIALGVLTGAGGINVAHELMHRRSRLDRALAETLMASVTYTWFCVEHVLGHHRHIGTPGDPATSRLGESVYRFLPRTLSGGLTSFWSIERDYAQRRGIARTSWRDRRTRYFGTLAAVYLLLAGVGGLPAVLFFALQSAVAIGLLEVINYVEHYGLVRAESRPGTFERVQPRHSWNSTHRLTNWFLFHLPRHADHHANASRPYWQLRAFPDAPQLPYGYATMVVVALVPPLWFRLMDPQVAAVRARGAASA